MLVKCEKDERAAELLRCFFSEWIEANPVGVGVGWHSYPISRRIVSWVQSVSLALPEIVLSNSALESAFLGSLYQQTRYLEDHLEFDIEGNHLLANAKALVFAGIFFGGKAGARWHEKGIKLLWRGLHDQILADGGHYERSPMYHAGMLQDYLEVVSVQHLNNNEVPQSVHQRLIAMGDFLAGIRHPDGEIPLFADSAFGITHKTPDILAAAERLLDVPSRWANTDAGLYCALFAPRKLQYKGISTTVPPRRTSWPDTGYFTLPGVGAGDKLIVDAKPMGPDHLPAHGHCSLFSYELSISGERLIVDSGVEEYEPGPWRDFWRSTRAHNALTVDGAEQSEIWAAFRVGQRAQLIESGYLKQNSSSLFLWELSTGLRDKRNPIHTGVSSRRSRKGFGWYWMRLEVRGGHTIESLVHLSPNADCQVKAQYADVSLGSVRVRVYPYCDHTAPACKMSCLRGEVNLIQGWYAPRFGERRPNTVLSFSCDSSLPARLGYLIAPASREITSWDAVLSDPGKPIQVNISVTSPQGNLRVHFDARSASLAESREK